MFLNQHLGSKPVYKDFIIVLESVQITLGTSSVLLSATLCGKNGPIIDGSVPVRWEQISGVPVTFTQSLAALDTIFTNPADELDRIFRIHVYENTPAYAYKDILVAPNPTEIMKARFVYMDLEDYWTAT